MSYNKRQGVAENANPPAYEGGSASLEPVDRSIPDPLGLADVDCATSPSLAVDSDPNDSSDEDQEDHERAERLAADQQLYEALEGAGFQGPVWDRFADMLARYGFPRVRAWVLTMRIFHESALKGVKGPRGAGRGGRPFADDDADQLAGDTVTAAIIAFRDKVLVPGRWSPGGGASLRSFFFQQCLFAFPNVYRRWRRESRARPEFPLYVDTDDGQTELLIEPADSSAGGDPAGMVAAHDEVLHALREVVRNDRDRAMVVLRAAGYADHEIADLLDETQKTVEGVFYRLRQRGRSRQVTSQPKERG